MPRTLVRDLRSHIGQQVTVYGWVNTLRLQRKMQFVLVRDHTGMVQVTHQRPDGGSALGSPARSPHRPSPQSRSPAVWWTHARSSSAAWRSSQSRWRSRTWPPRRCRSTSTPAWTSAWTGVSWTCAVRPAADVRRADHRRAGACASTPMRRAHRDAHPQAHGHRLGVRRGGLQARLLRPHPPIWRSRRSSTSRWRSPPASTRSSRSGRSSAPSRRSPPGTPPSSRASTWRWPGSTASRT